MHKKVAARGIFIAPCGTFIFIFQLRSALSFLSVYFSDFPMSHLFYPPYAQAFRSCTQHQQI